MSDADQETPVRGVHGPTKQYDQAWLRRCETERERLRNLLLTPPDMAIADFKPPAPGSFTVADVMVGDNRIDPEHVNAMVENVYDSAVRLDEEMRRMKMLAQYPGQNILAPWYYSGYWDNQRLLDRLQVYGQYVEASRSMDPEEARAVLTEMVVAPMLLGGRHKDVGDPTSEWILTISDFCMPDLIRHNLEVAQELDARVNSLSALWREISEQAGYVWESTGGRLIRGAKGLGPFLALGLGIYVGTQLLRSRGGE